MSASPTPISLLSVYARNDNARHLIAGLAATTPAPADIWQQVDQALDDIPVLGAVIALLSAKLARTRLDRANLIAAIRAALAAYADGDADPLSYLRDELAEIAERGDAR